MVYPGDVLISDLPGQGRVLLWMEAERHRKWSDKKGLRTNPDRLGGALHGSLTDSETQGTAQDGLK